MNERESEWTFCTVFSMNPGADGTGPSARHSHGPSPCVSTPPGPSRKPGLDFHRWFTSQSCRDQAPWTGGLTQQSFPASLLCRPEVRDLSQLPAGTARSRRKQPQPHRAAGRPDRPPLGDSALPSGKSRHTQVIIYLLLKSLNTLYYSKFD